MENITTKLNSFIQNYYNNEKEFDSLFDPNYDPIQIISKQDNFISNLLNKIFFRQPLPNLSDKLNIRLLKRITKLEQSKTFSEYLFFIIEEKKLNPTQVYKNALIDRRLFSKIKSNCDYHPNKLTVLCFCIGLQLTLDESKELLSRAGYSFAPCDKTDLIFSFFIEEKIYDMDQINTALSDYGMSMAGQY